jgi:tRNA-Thr(GGU) m(6)t(6)A37 methyltransferase TsaA
VAISYQPIGLIHSPFRDIAGMPIQPSGAANIQGRVELFSEFEPGLKDLAGFSHIILLYHFHQVQEPDLLVKPFMDSQARGIFATRAPKRPNPIGISVVELLEVEQNILRVKNIDILDGTPLLDIKPYVPEFDQHPADRVGWLEQLKGQVQTHRADRRFQSSRKHS